ncbi:hypothetical protein G6F31_021103 [Rhizopus arrhizus]|nr:hypothetical protein G6F31_021103 [Rhizopus arrhizus]
MAAQRAARERPGHGRALLHAQFAEHHIEQVQRRMALILLLQEFQPGFDLTGRAVVGQQLLGHQARVFRGIGHHRLQVQAFTLGVLLHQGQARAQHGRAYHRAFAQ